MQKDISDTYEFEQRASRETIMRLSGELNKERQAREEAEESERLTKQVIFRSAISFIHAKVLLFVKLEVKDSRLKRRITFQAKMSLVGCSLMQMSLWLALKNDWDRKLANLRLMDDT